MSRGKAITLIVLGVLVGAAGVVSPFIAMLLAFENVTSSETAPSPQQLANDLSSSVVLEYAAPILIGCGLLLTLVGTVSLLRGNPVRSSGEDVES